jgi:hypothetical protein
MSEENVNDAPVFNYSAPTTTSSNQDQAGIAALVEKLVADRLAAMNVQAVPVVKELTPEEQARAAIDNKGVGLGVEERLQELYRHLDTLAKKVGI